jgi:hypothetical protein
MSTFGGLDTDAAGVGVAFDCINDRVATASKNAFVLDAVDRDNEFEHLRFLRVELMAQL